MSGIGLGPSNARATTSDTRASEHTLVVQPSTSSGALRTPRDVMRNREEREARRRADAERVRREEEERRRSAERRAAAAAPGRTSGEQRRSGDSTTDEARYPQASLGGSLSKRTPLRAAGQQTYPTPSTQETLGNPGNDNLDRTKATTRPAIDTRPAAPQQQTAPRRAQPATSGLRQSSAPAPTTSGAAPLAHDGAFDSKQTRANASSFPHAFERWETLSSHWEGLTSYWLHKLEANQEQLAKSIPSASAMSRQITDLSAAGANLFHAVVELQRLRASSERKFQRWFFETRTEQERTQETHAELEKALRIERTARQDAEDERARAERDNLKADTMVKEMRRELQISKEEARRAWEELGRREQEERDRTTSLREGMPTVVGGVQVVPMQAGQGFAHMTSGSHQPTAAQYEAGQPQSHQQMYEEDEYYEDRPSPTNTDPFTEAAPPARQEPEVRLSPSDPLPSYLPAGTPTFLSSAQTANVPAQSRQVPMSASPQPDPQLPVRRTTASPAPVQYYDEPKLQPPVDAPTRFYQHAPQQTSLYNPTQNPPHDRPASATPTHQAARDLRSSPSYVSSVQSTEGTEYELDSSGRIVRDDQGRPLMYQRPHDEHDRRQHSVLHPSEGSDDYDVEADIARERQLAARYGSARTPVPTSSAAQQQPASSTSITPSPRAAPSPVVAASEAVSRDQRRQEGQATVPAMGYSYVGGSESSDEGSARGGNTGMTSTAGADAGMLTAGSRPDYSGQAYGGAVGGAMDQGSGGGSGGGSDWEQLRTAHHHPTRLSDVLEEEEEGRSRASHGSRH